MCMRALESKTNKDSIKLVFSNPKYLIMSIVIFIGMLVSLSIFSGYIFLEPFWVFYVLYSDIFNFSLLVFISILTGLVMSMGIYRIRILQVKARKMGSGVIGSLIGAGAGACGCFSMNVTLLSMFGVFGSSIVSFSTEYATPLRLVSIAILGFTYFINVRGITSECKIDHKIFQVKCSDCGCSSEECKKSNSPTECPHCDCGECCCWATIQKSLPTT